MSDAAPAPRSLPPRPSLEHLRKQAKDRLDDLRRDRPTAALSDAQRDLARAYGLPSWRALKARVDEINDARHRPFVDALDHGDLASVREALDRDPTLARAGLQEHRRTALHLAAAKGQAEIVRLLLERGADANARDRGDHAYPMHFAAESGHLDVVRALIRAGGDVRGGGDTHGLGVLGWATCFATVHQDVAELLLRSGAKHHIFSAVAVGDAEAVRRVVEQDPSSLTRPMSRYENHRTPLHLAVSKRRHDMIDLLLDLGADPRLGDKDGHTAMHLAAGNDDDDAIRRFENHGIATDEAAATGNVFRTVMPILRIADLQRSLDYYTQKLGFGLAWRVEGFASVQRHDVTIFLCQGEQGHAGTWLFVVVEDVDALHAELRQRGATIRQEPTNFPWGSREMNVEDPDGHRLRLASDATGDPDGVPLTVG
ncbi:MAG: glyoxalase superfamily protein [Planctomycetota bacterium]